MWRYDKRRRRIRPITIKKLHLKGDIFIRIKPLSDKFDSCQLWYDERPHFINISMISYYISLRNFLVFSFNFEFYWGVYLPMIELPSRSSYVVISDRSWKRSYKRYIFCEFALPWPLDVFFSSWYLPTEEKLFLFIYDECCITYTDYSSYSSDPNIA